MCKWLSLDGPKLFLCCNESCTVGLVPFLCSMKDSTAVCSLRSAPLVMAQHTIWVVFGNRATLGGFSGMVTILKWCPFCLPSRQPPTRWSRQCLVTVVTLAAPPSGALYLMTWRILLHTRTHTHTDTPIHKHTIASVCWHLTPHIKKGHMKETFVADFESVVMHVGLVGFAEFSDKTALKDAKLWHDD